jgi:hypothetical protein
MLVVFVAAGIFDACHEGGCRSGIERPARVIDHPGTGMGLAARPVTD